MLYLLTLSVFSLLDIPYIILKPMHRQCFLPGLIPAWTIFPTCFNTWLNNLFTAIFFISALALSLRQRWHKHFFYWCRSLHRQSFPPTSIYGQTILHRSIFHLSAFIEDK